jgi:FlaG/FlaF family flagellin (archaellin)
MIYIEKIYSQIYKTLLILVSNTAMSKEDGISPTMGVIVMVAITVALGVVIGTVALDLGGSTEESVQAGVDIQQQGDGEYQIQWQTAGNAEELQVLVNGNELENATLSNPGDSTTISVSEGDTISVSGTSGDSTTQVSSTTASSGNTSTPTVTSSPGTTLSSSTSGDTYKQGGSVSMDYTVTNESNSEKDISMSLDVDNGVGQVDSTTESTVSSDETRTGSLTWSVPSGQSPGEYTLTVSGGGELTTKTITIEKLEMSTTHNSAPSDYSAVLSNTAGTGTSSDPHIITNDHELQAIHSDPSAHYEIANDIDASGTVNWNGGKGFEPLSRYYNFDGSIDGNGYEIHGLYINRQDSTWGNVGLVGSNAGTIKNIGLVNADLHGGSSTTGGIASRNEGLLENVYVKGVVDGNDDTGGITGNNDGTIRQAYTTGTVNGGSGTGGIASSNSDSGNLIEYTYSSATIQPGSYDPGDPICPYNTHGTITGSSGLSESEMTGDSAKTNMSNFDFTNTWKTVDGDTPKLQTP